MTSQLLLKRGLLWLLPAVVMGWVPAASVQADTITVFAAASLKESLDAAARAYEANSTDRVVISYAASSALARQIEAGAPADLFISADLDWMDYLAQRRLIRPETRRNLLRNRLVLIARADNAVQVTLAKGFPLARLLGDGRLAMANPDAVPAGKYGKAALEALGAWTGVQGRIVAADNVRAALSLVARGEAPLGIVYNTDAVAERGVRVAATFPEATHPPIVYPLAVVAGGKHAAAGFAQWLAGASALAIFSRFGF